MRIGVLGSGFMGGTHARAYAKLPDVDVVAVSSLHRDKAEALAAEVGARATTDNMAIIGDPSIEAISNTLPTHLHAEFTIAALEAGKHVLLEKPFALDVADCDRMIAAAQASGKMLVVAHVLRFWGAYVSLTEIVASGRLGRPMSAVASMVGDYIGTDQASIGYLEGAHLFAAIEGRGSFTFSPTIVDGEPLPAPSAMWVFAEGYKVGRSEGRVTAFGRHINMDYGEYGRFSFNNEYTGMEREFRPSRIAGVYGRVFGKKH